MPTVHRPIIVCNQTEVGSVG